MSCRRKKRQPHVLILRFSALGDVAMTLPVIYSVARAYPDVRFTVATREFFSRLFINPPANVDVIGFDLKKRYHGTTGTLRLCLRLARLKPTAVADLHNVFRTWVIDAFLRMRGIRTVMVDKMRSERRRMLRDKTEQTPFVDRYRDVFSRLGYPAEMTFRSVFADGNAEAPFEVRYPAVGLAPFARYYNKTYPPELMRQVAETLCCKGIHVYLFGARGSEADELRQWAGSIRGCESVAGKYSLPQEMTLMSQMNLMVSMDSANQHLAALTGARVLTIWGSTTPACGFTAFGHTAADGICMNLGCQPCTVAGSPTCPRGHLDCLCMITPQTVASQIEKIIKQ